MSGALALLPGCVWDKPLLTVAEGELSPLQRAAREGNRVEVARLVAAQVDLEAPTPTGETALVQACWYGHGEVAALLLDRGADLKARGPVGVGALEAATLQGHYELARALMRRGAKLAEPAQFAVIARMLLGVARQASFARELEAAGLPPGSPSPSQLLQTTVLAGDSAGLRRVLAAPTPATEAEAWAKGRAQAFGLACTLGDPGTVRAFLEAGLSATAADEAGRTPLHKVYEGLGMLTRLQVVVDPDEPPTVMKLLEEHLGRRLGESRHAVVIRMLIEKGADPAVQDRRGKTPEDLASEAWNKVLEKVRKAAWKE